MDRSRSHGLLKGVEFNYEVMEEELTCPVCLELYADPLILACSHSVCKKCLQDIFDSKYANDSTNSEHELECPSCRRTVTLSRDQISDLPKNLALENIVIRYSEERSKSIRKSLSLESPVSDLLLSPILDLDDVSLCDAPRICELCDNGAAAWSCNQCRVSYCHACLTKYHPNKGALSRHKLTRDVGEAFPERFCADHEKDVVTMYCDDCRVYACHLCVCDGEGKHAGHKMLLPRTAQARIREAIEETKSTSDMLLCRLLEQRGRLQTYTEEIKTLHNQTVARVEQHYCRLVADISSALTSEKGRILKQLSALYSTETTRVKDSLHDNEMCASRLETVSKDCVQLTEKDAAKLLSHGGDLQPLRTLLQEEGNQTEVLTNQFDLMIKNKSLRSRLQAGAQDFTDGSSRVLKLFHGMDHQTIVPAVQTPLSSGRSSDLSPGGRGSDLSPRAPVQNKCLLTWGFSSTSFTGEQLKNSATWTVTIEKNHSGHFNTGCLFGVGISSQPLNIKDLVGTTDGTFGLVCNNGQIMFSEAGKQEHLVALETLPLSLTLSVSVDDKHYTVIAYKMESAAGSECQNLPLEGRKVLDDPRLKMVVYPVFTVSQRVKLLFPTYV